MIASVWSSLVDVALGGAAVVLLWLVCRLWRLEERVQRLEGAYAPREDR